VDFDDYSAGDPTFASGLAFYSRREIQPHPDGNVHPHRHRRTAMASGPGTERFCRGRMDSTEIFYLMKEGMGI